MADKIVIGTLPHASAMRRAASVAERLRRGWDVQIQPFTPGEAGAEAHHIRSAAAKRRNVAPLEEALLAGRIHLAVHSLTELPAQTTPGLYVGAVPARNGGDVLVGGVRLTMLDQPTGARLAVFNPLQLAQMQNRYPHLRFMFRGETVERIVAQMTGNDVYTGAILPGDEVELLGYGQMIVERLPETSFVPEVGQGVTAIVARIEDHAADRLLRFLNDEPTALLVRAERAFLRELEGDQPLALGAWARLAGEDLVIEGALAANDGRTLYRMRQQGRKTDPETVGVGLANQFVQRGTRVLAQEAIQPNKRYN